MPDQWSRTQILQLVVLVLAVPVQYLLTRTSTENLRQYEIKKVLSGLSDLSRTYLSWSRWMQWCGQFWGQLLGNDTTTPPAEVLKNHNKEGHFASKLFPWSGGWRLWNISASKEPRSPRPPHIRFRVGQVVKHTRWGYRGVVVGWDEVARAPTDWLNEMHPKDKPEWRQSPNYAVLVDTRDRLTPQMAYVVEENLELLSNTQVFHPLVEHHFEAFDGAQYLMRPWLKRVYPHD